jgi:hypothetical protein
MGGGAGHILTICSREAVLRILVMDLDLLRAAVYGNCELVETLLLVGANISTQTTVSVE